MLTWPMRAVTRLVAVAVVVVPDHRLCWARPTNPQEGSDSGFAVNYLKGAWVGAETVLGLTGFWSHDTCGEWGCLGRGPRMRR